MKKKWLGWHFLAADGKIAIHSRSEHGGTLVTPGLRLSISGKLMLCSNGLHASRRAIDALRYAPGPVVERVELSGKILEDGDKACATTRTCLWVMDASLALRVAAVNFAQIALDAEIAAGRPVDKRSTEALAVALRFAHGKADKKELAAASASAYAAAYAAAAAAASAAAAAASAAADDATYASAYAAAAALDHKNEILEIALLTQYGDGGSA